jgi:membrane associated rhomboid family serine protease
LFPVRDNIRSRSFPFVNYLIVLINVAVFWREFTLNADGLLEPFLAAHALVPARFLADPAGHVATIFSSMFLHGGWMHVIGNMWFLLIFGDNVEDKVGHVRYAFFYLLCGFGAAAAQVAADPASHLPMIGASGAIAGVLGAYFLFYPRARVLTLFVFVIFVRFIEVPAFFFLLFWFLSQAMNGLGALSAQAVQAETGGVAWFAHAGGFLVGIVSGLLFRR